MTTARRIATTVMMLALACLDLSYLALPIQQAEARTDMCSDIHGPDPATRPVPGWTSCQQDSDCVMADDGICGVPTAVNTASARTHARYVQCMNPVIDCEVLDRPPGPYTARCVASQCQAITIPGEGSDEEQVR